MKPVLALLADAPTAGAILPQVASEVGTAQAVRLYRVLLARAIAAARGAGLTSTVWFRPADAGPEFRRWLGDQADLRPQASGDLGARAAAAVAGVNLPDGWLVLLRPVAGMDAQLLRRAHDLLMDHPIVLGAASDGGLYLVGGRVAPLAAIRALEHAGPGTLAGLRGQLEEDGIGHAELPVRRTIESAADARAARLLN